MIGPELKVVMDLLAKLPGLGPRSGRRVALHLLKNQEKLMRPLAHALQQAADSILFCKTCGNIDTQPICAICRDQRRNKQQICVIEDVADLWAIERGNQFKGTYQVLGGVMSALEGVGPEQLNIPTLVERAQKSEVSEVILALNATVDSQTTAHYIAECLRGTNVTISALANGVPLGGELDYLDDGTISMALNARRKF
jgi:recombination protein RecR